MYFRAIERMTFVARKGRGAFFVSSACRVNALCISRAFVVVRSIGRARSVLFCLYRARKPCLYTSSITCSKGNAFGHFGGLEGPILINFHRFLAMVRQVDLVDLLRAKR